MLRLSIGQTLSSGSRLNSDLTLTLFNGDADSNPRLRLEYSHKENLRDDIGAFFLSHVSSNSGTGLGKENGENVTLGVT